MDMHHNAQHVKNTISSCPTAHSTTLVDSCAYLHLLDGTDINEERRMHYKELKKVTVVLRKQCNSLFLTDTLQKFNAQHCFPQRSTLLQSKQSLPK